jgi:chemotaxis signal transduction protein
MTPKINSFNLEGQTGGDPLPDTALDGLGTLEWLEQELLAKSAQYTKPSMAAAVSPLTVEVDLAREEAESSAPEKSMRHLVFALQSRRYALPLANVVEVGRPTHTTPSGSSPEWLSGHSKFRGEDLALVDMRRFLGLAGRDSGPGVLVVVRSLRQGSQMGLIVDEICEIAPVSENVEVAAAPEGATFPFLRDTQQAGQPLTLVDAEQMLLSSPMRSFTSPAGLTHAREVKTTEGTGVQERVAEASRHIRRTADRSKEMSAIIQMMADMAEQTRLLAMNASIQAAAAGEPAQDFALIAAEIERLAGRSAHSSRQLRVILESVESEAAAAAAGLDSTAGDVARLSQQATRADGCISDIEGVSSTLMALVENISQATEAQSRSSHAVARAMEDMLGKVREIERSAVEAEQAAGSLSALTGDLKSSRTR